MSTIKIDLNKIKKDKLVSLCKKNNLTTNGTKKQLHDRLLRYYKSVTPRRRRVGKTYHARGGATMRVYQQGGWNPKQHAGIIIAHGKHHANKLVIIPEGMSIRTLSEAGVCPTKKEYVSNDQLETRETRAYSWTQDIHGNLKGRIHESGEIMVDLFLKFKATWGELGKGLTYVNTGVFTDGQIKAKVHKEKPQMTDEQLRDKSMLYSDPNIIPIKDWGETYTMGEVIKRIVQAGKAGRYYLNACRVGEMIDTFPTSCGEAENKRETLLKSRSAIYTENVHDKLRRLKNLVPWKTQTDIQSTKTIIDRLGFEDQKFHSKGSFNLKRFFLMDLADYMIDRIGINYDYTISIEEFCNFLDVYDMAIGKVMRTGILGKYVVPKKVTDKWLPMPAFKITKMEYDK